MHLQHGYSWHGHYQKCSTVHVMLARKRRIDSIDPIFFTVVEFRTADHAWWNTNRLATVACLLKKNCLDGR